MTQETGAVAGGTPQGLLAYRRLIAEIRDGALRPGTRLRETELAGRLGISRTPVREAIRLLEADGLVVHVPRVGAAVRQLDYPEVMELYEMRTVLEGTAARMAARAASEIEIAELEALNAEMQAAGDDAVRIHPLNRKFHLTLLDAAKNRFLLKAMGALQKTLMILGPSTLAERDRPGAAAEEHARIIAALRTRDPDRAEAAMRAHIEAAHRMRLRQLRDRARETCAP